MNLSFIRSDRFQKMAIFIFVTMSIMAIIIYFALKDPTLPTVPKEVSQDAEKLGPDSRFASTWSHSSIASDPVSDKVSQELISQEKKQKEADNSKNQDEKKDETKAKENIVSTSIFTPNGIKITTTSDNSPSELAKDIFHPSTNTPLGMKNDLVDTESQEEKNLYDEQNNTQNLGTSISNRNFAQAPIPKNIKRSKYDLLLASNGGELVQLKGRDSSIGGSDYQIKAGMRVLALLPDKLVVTSAATQPTSLYVIGPMDQFNFPRGYVITAIAKLNATEDRIDIETNYCSSAQNRNKSVSCVGTIKGVDGTTGLSGEIYNMSMWSAIAAFATSSLAAIPLSQISQTATSYGPVQSVNVTNSINTALAAGIQSIGQSIQKGFDKSGTQISIPQGSIVQILFTEDTIL